MSIVERVPLVVSVNSFNRACRQILSRPYPSELTTKQDRQTLILETIGDNHFRLHFAGLYRVIQGATRARLVAERQAKRDKLNLFFVGE